MRGEGGGKGTTRGSSQRDNCRKKKEEEVAETGSRKRIKALPHEKAVRRRK